MTRKPDITVYIVALACLISFTVGALSMWDSTARAEQTCIDRNAERLMQQRCCSCTQSEMARCR